MLTQLNSCPISPLLFLLGIILPHVDVTAPQREGRGCQLWTLICVLVVVFVVLVLTKTIDIHF